MRFARQLDARCTQDLHYFGEQAAETCTAPCIPPTTILILERRRARTLISSSFTAGCRGDCFNILMLHCFEAQHGAEQAAPIH